jgi:hypothetical protein
MCSTISIYALAYINIQSFVNAIDLSSLPNLKLLRILIPYNANWTTVHSIVSRILAPTRIQTIIFNIEHFHHPAHYKALDSTLIALPVKPLPTLEVESAEMYGLGFREYFPRMAARDLVSLRRLVFLA